MPVDKALLEKAYTTMLRSRLFEDGTERLFAQGELYGTTHLATGQEALHAGLVLALEKKDFITSTHRCHGYAVARGTDLFALYSELFGSRYGTSMGLCGSMHFFDKEHYNCGTSAIVGSGVPLALGYAFSLKREGKKNISVAVFGDGASSRGTVHESMNLASVFNLPVLFFCENNHYGMSAASDRMVSTSSIAKRAEGYNIPYATVDGNDFQAVYEAVLKARESIIETGRPYFLECDTYRQKGHSKNDKRTYRSAEEEAFWLNKDPVKKAEALLDTKTAASVRALVEKEINDAIDKARVHRGEVLNEDEVLKLALCGEKNTVLPEVSGLTYREAIRKALYDELSSDPSVFLLGEDIGLYGGCFKVTGDLYKSFPGRIVETPVSEESFTGMAVGAARTGMHPVVEVMYADFATLISDPIINHAAKTLFMSAGTTTCPITVRLPEGAGTGHGPQHTQSPESMFLGVSGLKVVAPSCPEDAYTLLRQAIQSPNPVLYFEHKALYDTKQVFPCPRNCSIDRASVIKEGKDVSLIAYGKATGLAYKAALILKEKGIDAEVLDLRIISPIDKESVLRSVRKTGKAVIIQCCAQSASAGTTVAAMLGSYPFALVSSRNTPVPFTRELEKTQDPSVQQIVEAFESL